MSVPANQSLLDATPWLILNGESHSHMASTENPGFIASEADSSLFILNDGSVHLYILVYVDDIFVTCSDDAKLHWFLSQISATFPVKDLGGSQYVPLTRPDISFAVNKLCQFMHSPTVAHWQAVKRLLRYLQHAKPYGLCVSKDSSLEMQCFTNSDWGGDVNDRRSTSGYAVYLGRNLISWMAKKQLTIARSSSESEYKTLANATAKIMWIKSLMSELGFQLSQPAVLWCDNIGAIYLSSNPVFYARTKHIELDYHFVR
ncbi:hypothetical protein GH714_034845 [Hevea brasiliensis]|uniref:Reverse transcriptase Ty1/copia-type domain-containing protein n=1 Tax=Hevea brasiliensis TaxID=3981 RepID=A0A6A6ND16_HEVBR|nr:hypothetical protein GH714_034845 [Hevea brasiliensis]